MNSIHPVFPVLRSLACLMILAFSDMDLRAQITDITGVDEGIRGAFKVHTFDTRTAALGDATVSDVGYLTGMNINPASLAFVKRPMSIHMNTAQYWNTNVLQESITFPLFFGRSHYLAGQAGLYHGGTDFMSFTESRKPQPDIFMHRADLAYAWSFENILSIGVLNSLTYSHNEYAQFWTYFASAGFLYVPSESVTYGIVLRGLGRSTTYEFIEDGRTTLGSQVLRKSLELGATLKYPEETKRHLIALSLANEKRFGEEGIWYKSGLEIKPWNFLALRSGILFHPENGIYTPRFGTGLQIRSLQIDYSLSYKDQLYERFHQMGIIIYR